MIRHIEIVCWRGDVDALALRLGCAPADLLMRLQAVGRNVTRTPIRLDVSLANTAPIWSAVRRRLAPAPDAANSAIDGRLCATMADEY